MNLDLSTLTLSGLFAIGVVNVAGFFFPDIDSRVKFALSFVAALLVAFVPVELGSMILDKAKEAIVVAFAASGTYKLFTKAGEGVEKNEGSI